jgi:hypothetical protein
LNHQSLSVAWFSESPPFHITKSSWMLQRNVELRSATPFRRIHLQMETTLEFYLVSGRIYLIDFSPIDSSEIINVSIDTRT